MCVSTKCYTCSFDETSMSQMDSDDNVLSLSAVNVQGLMPGTARGKREVSCTQGVDPISILQKCSMLPSSKLVNAFTMPS